ncbi:MAG: hypothetical protein ACREU2_02125 [Steroidobacteraceae bacterium]
MSPRAVLPAMTLLTAGLVLAGCTIPLLHGAHSTNAADSSASPTDTKAECASLSEQIKTNQIQVRQAPSTSVNEDIVAAAQGNAAKRLDDLRSQYDSLGCSAAQLPPSSGRFAPLPPAPGGPQR